MTPQPDDGAQAALTVGVHTEDDRAAVVSATGEVDAASVELLRKELTDLADADQVNVILDLSGVTFLDSSGLGALVSSYRRLQTRGGMLALVCRNDMVLRVFRLTGLNRVLPIFATLEEAFATEFAG